MCLLSSLCATGIAGFSARRPLSFGGKWTWLRPGRVWHLQILNNDSSFFRQQQSNSHIPCHWCSAVECLESKVNSKGLNCQKVQDGRRAYWRCWGCNNCLAGFQNWQLTVSKVSDPEVVASILGLVSCLTHRHVVQLNWKSKPCLQDFALSLHEERHFGYLTHPVLVLPMLPLNKFFDISLSPRSSFCSQPMHRSRILEF